MTATNLHNHPSHAPSKIPAKVEADIKAAVIADPTLKTSDLLVGMFCDTIVWFSFYGYFTYILHIISPFNYTGKGICHRCQGQHLWQRCIMEGSRIFEALLFENLQQTRKQVSSTLRSKHRSMIRRHKRFSGHQVRHAHIDITFPLQCASNRPLLAIM